MLMAEAHMPQERTRELLHFWKTMNYKAVVAPAYAIGRSNRGTSGGCTAAIRTTYQAASYRHLACKPEQAEGTMQASFTPGPIDFTDFAPMAWKVDDFTLTIGSIYLLPGLGAAGEISGVFAMPPDSWPLCGHPWSSWVISICRLPSSGTPDGWKA